MCVHKNEHLIFYREYKSYFVKQTAGIENRLLHNCLRVFEIKSTNFFTDLGRLIYNFHFV